MRAVKVCRLCETTAKRAFVALILCFSLLTGCSMGAEEAKQLARTEVGNNWSSIDKAVERNEWSIPEEEIVEEPQPESFIFSFAGDCTLADMGIDGRVYTYFTNTVGEDYGWPFRNVKEFFENDEMTFVNFEGVLGLGGYLNNEPFTFHINEAYGQCLIEGDIDVVTLANNHAYDYGTTGYEGTKTHLDEWGIPYVGYNDTLIHYTPNGLKIGFYAACWPNETYLKAAMEQLKAEEPDLIICAFHFGNEGFYYPDWSQNYYSHLAIDLGADIVYGSHPHVLEQIEEYENGIIYYSMGNFCFGGNPNPKDYDSVIIQQEIIREVDGEVHLGEFTLIPCSVSSEEKNNNYQPTPYEVGSPEYERALKKLAGEYEIYCLSFQYY